jgi:hypothetical protein
VAHTAATFKARWPEFAPTADATVTAVLAEATRGCNAAVFGDRFDEAVGLLCAHKLAISPGAQSARLESDKADTVYRAEWLRVARACGGGPWAMGQDP